MDKLTTAATKWRGMAAWTVTGARLNLVVTAIGGHLAAVRENGDEVNPLWQPPWPAVDPATIVPGPDCAHGAGPESTLLATIVGHNLCLDRFGPPWPGEQRPVHGEAGVAHWTMTQPKPDTVEFAATLPEAKLRVVRRFQCDGLTARITTAVSHDGAGVREIEWAEHATVGDPFLDGARFTAGVDQVVNWPGEAEPGSRFFGAKPEASVPVAEALGFPSNGGKACGDVLCGRVSDGWWTAENPRLKRKLTYRWDAKQFPWLALWTQHRARTNAPWNGKTRSRGMEFSTKPFPEGKPPAARATTYLDRPTVCKIPAKTGIEHWMTITWEKIGA